MSVSQGKINFFQKTVWDYYAASGRENLPWRKKINPYKVWVSEIMLQQTQVDRVIPFFTAWMQSFPTIQKLADAPQTEILKHWKGLGYNSRALRMKQAAQVIIKKYDGKFPQGYDDLINLPGVGPYTAGAICAFAYNQPVVIIETNIRRVIIHHFFDDRKNIHDKEILEIIIKTLDQKNPRQWYWALMDYGSYLGKELKSHGKKYNPNVQSRHYTKQKTFKGSDRQIRGKILEILLAQKKHVILFNPLFKKLEGLSDNHDRIEVIVDQLEKENFIVVKNQKIQLKK